MPTEWDTDDAFGEMWFPVESQKVLAFVARCTGHLAGDVIEIGSWTGRSTCVLANAVHPSVVRAVDTWEGSPGEVSAELAAERDIFTQFKENVAAFTLGNVRPYRMGWREYFENHPRPVRLCFIDAEHTYEEVHDNVETVLPLMMDGGILCGDDIRHPPVERAVDELLPNVKKAASMWVWRA